MAALAVLAALAGLVWGIRVLALARVRVETDDAQVEGHIIPVLARVGGYVRTVNVGDNEEVRTDQILVEVDDRDLRARLARAEADLAVTQSNAGGNGQAVAQLEAARASVRQAEADARRADSDLERYRGLAGRDIITPQQLDAAEAAAASARAQVAAAQNRVAAASAQVRGAGGQVAAALAARDEAALELSYARITAPNEGVVSEKSVEIGQLVQPGQALLAVVPLREVWIVANLKETQLRHVRPGQVADIRADTYPGRVVRGHVESLSAATGAKFSLLPPDNASGNFVKVVQRVPVKILIDSPFDPARPLRPGMSVRVSIHTES
jgi:membrane fusion protein (multidrug efflux system)